jgi:hypothetical protein
MNNLSTEINANTDLSLLFSDIEIQVILTEVFYLPQFLWEREIKAPEDICHHLIMPMEKVLNRLQQIYAHRLLFLGILSRDVCEDRYQARCIHFAEVSEPGQERDQLVGDLLESKVPLIVFGENPCQVFSTAMYLVEEGAPVSSYFISK